MKPYIVISGTHSTGKSTLVRAAIPMLEDMYKSPVYHISEVARKLKTNFGVSINKEASSETQRLIESTYAREEEAQKDLIRVADRSVIDRFTYTLLSEAVSDSELVGWYGDNIKNICNKYSHIFYVPLTPDLKLELDGTRSSDEEFRKKVDETMHGIIRAYNINVFVLSGSTEQRLQQMKKVLTEDN